MVLKKPEFLRPSRDKQNVLCSNKKRHVCNELLYVYFIDNTMNLQEFIDMTNEEGEGQVMDYKTFIKSFSSTN